MPELFESVESNANEPDPTTTYALGEEGPF
jgi:hypothetical protein